MTKQNSGRILLMLAALLAVLAGGLIAYRWTRPRFVPPALPVPNGYDDLLRAADMLAPRTGFYDEMEPEELAAIAEQNQPALALARQGLEKEIGVSIDWSRNLADGVDPVKLDQVQAIRNLSRALVADLRDKLARGQTTGAVSDGIDVFRLGSECYRGGLLVDYLVGAAVQGVAVHELRQFVVRDPAERPEILRRLLPLLESGEPAENVIRRELQFSKSGLRGPRGWVMRLHYGTLRKLLEPALQAARQAELRSTAQQRLFVIHLALHAYRGEHGSWPNRLTDLSPVILTDLPLDPYSEAPFIYRVENGAYRLYGIGEDGQDDGGESDDTGLAPDVVYDLMAEDDQG